MKRANDSKRAISRRLASGVLIPFVLALGLTTCSGGGSDSPPVIVNPPPPLPPPPPPPAGKVYTNGNWYNGQDDSPGFVTGDVFIMNGEFVSTRPANPTVINLANAYVIPPFGEAHNHNVDSQVTMPTAARYIDEGVFYLKNPNNFASIAAPMRPHWQGEDTLDVVFANGGISVAGGHPDLLYRSVANLYGVNVDDIEGDAFYDAPTIAALNQKWPALLATNPDIIKLYLMRHNTPQSGGLSETVFREAVRLAKEVGLRTSVHLESLDDLRVALDAGADEMAHIVSRKIDTALTTDGIMPDALVDQIVAQDFVTVTTTWLATFQHDDRPGTLMQIQDVQKQNLRKLYDAGALIALGTDGYEQTTSDEIKTLRQIGVFTDPELLLLWIRTPEIAIYPDRKIGRFDSGYEASFLALGCDPFIRFECIDDIRRRVKQGEVITGN